MFSSAKRMELGVTSFGAGPLLCGADDFSTLTCGSCKSHRSPNSFLQLSFVRMALNSLLANCSYSNLDARLAFSHSKISTPREMRIGLSNAAGGLQNICHSSTKFRCFYKTIESNMLRASFMCVNLQQ